MSDFTHLKNTLKTHNDINNRIENLNKTLADLRNTRTALESDILIEINSLNLQNKKLRIEGAHYFLGVSKSKPPLNIALIEEIGNKYLGKNNTEKFIEIIKNHRDSNSTQTPTIKHRAIRPNPTKVKSIKNTNKEYKSQSLKKKLY